MKRLLIFLGYLVLCGPATGMEEWELPVHIRIIAEYIEAPHATVTEVMASEVADSGPKLHAHMRALVKEKKARIMETTIAVARPGQKATVEAFGAFISPEEWDGWNSLPGGDPPPKPP